MDTHLIANGLSLPPLTLETSFRTEEGVVVRADWRGRRNEFAAEVIRPLTPRKLRYALQEIKQQGVAGAGPLPMIIAPYLSPDSLAILADAEVSGIDLSGNGVVVVPGEWFVYRSGEKNRFPDSKPIKRIYRGTSSLVGRVLLSRPEFARFTDIPEEIRKRGGSISAPTVSKVLTQLEEDLVVERVDRKIQVLDAGRLLDRLRENYRPEVTATIRGIFTDPADTPAALRARAEAARTRLVLRKEQLYVNAPQGDDVMRYYTSSLSAVLKGSTFAEEPRYGDVELVQTPRQEVFFDPRQDGIWPCCSALQIYLELANGGKRERETAESLRADLLAYRYE